MPRLYDYPPSGDGYMVRLLLRLLEQSLESVEKDIVKGETRTPACSNRWFWCPP